MLSLQPSQNISLRSSFERAVSSPLLSHRTKIVATIGPASRSPEMIRRLMQAGMSVARLNFSHGSYEDHAEQIRQLRAVSAELEMPLTLLQDLQGPKIRVGMLPKEGVMLRNGAFVTLQLSLGYPPSSARAVRRLVGRAVPTDGNMLLEKELALPEDKVLLLGGLPIKVAGSTNFLKIHTIGQG